MTFFWDCNGNDCSKQGDLPIFNFNSAVTTSSGHNSDAHTSPEASFGIGVGRRQYDPDSSYDNQAENRRQFPSEPHEGSTSYGSQSSSYDSFKASSSTSTECYDYVEELQGYSASGVPKRFKTGANLYECFLQDWYVQLFFLLLSIYMYTHTHYNMHYNMQHMRLCVCMHVGTCMYKLFAFVSIFYAVKQANLK
jgi:hypothetical protein